MVTFCRRFSLDMACGIRKRVVRHVLNTLALDVYLRSFGHSTTVMSLLLSELVLRHEGVVRRAGTNSADGTGATVAAAAMGSIGESEFLSEANLLVILSDLVLHLPACATAIHRLG